MDNAISDNDIPGKNSAPLQHLVGMKPLKTKQFHVVGACAEICLCFDLPWFKPPKLHCFVALLPVFSFTEHLSV